MSVTRRTALQIGGAGLLGAAAISAPLASLQAKSAGRLAAQNTPRPFRAFLPIPTVLRPERTGVDADGVRHSTYKIRQTAGTARILPGLTTPVLGYNGVFPGPTIEVAQGTRATVRMWNKLPTFHPQFGYLLDTSTHLHGSASLPQFDGYANDVTAKDLCKDYEYPNFQPARTLWYHDHAVHQTARNVYSGLAAQYHMHDPVERALLPQGRFDIPLTVSDAMFNADGSLAFDDRSTSGLWGDIILVNGAPWPVLKVQRRVYRFRILNACISRSFRFALSTRDPVTVVATDGGLMPVAQQVSSWRHSGAERYEVLIDFTKYRPGQRVELRNLSNRNNIDYTFTNRIMAFDVTDEPVDTRDHTWKTLPRLLAPSAVMSLRPAQAMRTRRLRLQRTGGAWTINGVTWDDVIASGFRRVLANPGLNDVEIWEVENRSGGWFHPLHIHLVDFQILSRNGRPPFPYERGPKDVVYVGENETVRLLMKFEHHRGKYMVHCHNLPHEDHDMMGQFSVGLTPGQTDPHDPITAAPAHLEPDL